MKNSQLRIDILVNKKFEVEPFVAALMHLTQYRDDEGNPKFLTPSVINVPSASDKVVKPRVIYATDQYEFDVYCIEEMMDPRRNPSSSEHKHDILLPFLKKEAEKGLDYIISVSTAESTPKLQESLAKSGSLNGSVIFGHRYFLYNAGEEDSSSDSHLRITNSYIDFDGNYILNCVSSLSTQYMSNHNIKNPSTTLKIAAEDNFLSVGILNVEDYEIYKTADPKAYQAAVNNQNFNGLTPACIETTHGLIAMATQDAGLKIPVIFASPITDQYKCFDKDVTKTNGLQNFSVAYNGGIAVGQLLKLISLSFD